MRIQFLPASFVMVAAVAVSARPAAQVPAQSLSVAQILADARHALGGEARLNAIRTFRAKGSIRQGSSRTSNYGAFDFACELPDKFVETESMRYAGSGDGANVDYGAVRSYGSIGFGSGSGHEALIGFNGPRAIFEPRLPEPSRYNLTQTSLPITSAQLDRVLPLAQQDFVQLTIGLFAASYSGVPVTFSAATTTASGERAVLVTGTRSAVLRFDPQTHLPASLDALEYLDYRDVHGLKVPFRLRLRGTEWQVREFRYDVPIEAKVFRPTEGR